MKQDIPGMALCGPESHADGLDPRLAMLICKPRSKEFRLVSGGAA